jgi:hypothetical protein
LLTIEDVLEGVEEPVRWGMVTRADVTIDPDGKSAALKHSGKELSVSLKSENAKFEIVSTTPPTEKENQNQDYQMLAAYAEPVDGRVVIHVSFLKNAGL